VEEFTEWCDTAAKEWGYNVEVGGVGRAQEIDKWERDDELGWASQVAAFRRRDDGEWVAARISKSTQLLERAKARTAPMVIGSQHYDHHEASGRPGSLEDIKKLIKETMQKYQEEETTIHRLWFEPEIGILCGGYLHHMLLAIEADHEFTLRSEGATILDWIVHWDGLVRVDSQQIPEPPQQQSEDISDRGIESPSEPDDWIQDSVFAENIEWDVSPPVSRDDVWGETGWGNHWETSHTDGWSMGDWKNDPSSSTTVWG
jgi:small RNA 2'-O-methyltransferase